MRIILARRRSILPRPSAARQPMRLVAEHRFLPRGHPRRPVGIDAVLDQRFDVANLAVELLACFICSSGV